MRSLIISVLILCITLSVVCLNAFCVNKKTGLMLETFKSIYNTNEENTDKRISELCKLWDDTESLLSLCTNKKELDEIEHLLAEIIIAYAEKDNAALIRARSSTVDKIYEIRNTQIFDLKTIL